MVPRVGAAIYTALATAGAAVVANYSSSREAADQVVEQIIAAGGNAIAVQGDMSNAADVDQLFAKAQAEYGHLDNLLLNACQAATRSVDITILDNGHKGAIHGRSIAAGPARR